MRIQSGEVKVDNDNRIEQSYGSALRLVFYTIWNDT